MTRWELSLEREGILQDICTFGGEKAFLGTNTIAMGATISKQ